MVKKGMLLKFMDDEKNTIYIKKVTSLPVKEKCLIEKSIEFFDDPEPCMIHRSAVMTRLFSEVEDYLAKQLQEGITEHHWDTIPKVFQQYFDIDKRIIYVSVTIIC